MYRDFRTQVLGAVPYLITLCVAFASPGFAVRLQSRSVEPAWVPPFSGLKKYAAFDLKTAVAEQHNAQIALGSVEKHLGLLHADKPWEVRIDNGYPNVHYDGKERPAFRLWYDTCMESTRGICTGRDTKGTLYATSEDGVAWMKPNVGHIEWQGSTSNNIVYKGGHGLGIFRDPHETFPQRKFKAFGMTSMRRYGLSIVLKTKADKMALVENLNPQLQLVGDHGLDAHGEELKAGDTVSWSTLQFLVPFRPGPHMQPRDLKMLKLPSTVELFRPEEGGLLSSPDGIHWSLERRLILGNRWDAHHNMIWDEQHSEYVLFTRGTTYSGSQLNRSVARTSSRTLDGAFRAAQVVHAGKSLNDQLYSQMVFPFYSTYLAIVMTYDNSISIAGKDDRVKCELAWSPDTYSWFRFSDGAKKEVIPITNRLGDMDGYDCFAAKPVVVGNQVWVYYMGGDGPHFGKRNTFFNLAKLRMDGFAGVRPSDKARPAIIKSHPLQCSNSPPVVNIDVALGGSALVKLHGSSDQIIGISKLITTNSTDTPIQFFKDGTAVEIPSYCRLSFSLMEATLYTFGWV
mmetsp:Transcript_111271/g.346873  ORF Transcript_111271/g.346873 Transcript_111271/m.346873 type:complete len:570 (-) Transcript_111271:85-1794(-)